MNGITSVVLATGNDTRAVEAGAHAYAAITGRYTSLTTWEKNKEGNLVGTIEVPLAVGLVGGATKIHPIARLAIKILGVSTARQLAEVIASVGLARNSWQPLGPWQQKVYKKVIWPYMLGMWHQ